MIDDSEAMYTIFMSIAETGSFQFLISPDKLRGQLMTLRAKTIAAAMTAGLALGAELFMLCAAQTGLAQNETKELRITPHFNLTILDPIWTTACITRNHGYMIDVKS